MSNIHETFSGPAVNKFAPLDTSIHPHDTQADHFAIANRPRERVREREREGGSEVEKISLLAPSCSPSLQTSQLSSVRPRLFYSYVSLQPAAASWGGFFSLSFITISGAPAFEFDTCPPTQPSTRGSARETGPTGRRQPAVLVRREKTKHIGGHAQKNVNNKIKTM